MNKFKILLIFVIPFILNAKVSLKAPGEFYKGDKVVFSITAEGGDIKFPDIKNVEGYSVQNAGTSSQTSIINGVKSESLTRSYVFRPDKSLIIPSFKIEIDGQVEKTKEHILKAKEIQKTKSKYYSLDISVDKKDLYVGDAVKFTLRFKYRKDLQIVDLQFEKPVFENFWVKELSSKNNKNSKGDYVEQELYYLLFPQKSGKIVIDPLKIGIVQVDSRYPSYGGFFRSANTKTVPVYSNKLELNVKPLPGGVKLIGDFNIDAKVDKSEIDTGESVSYKIIISGRGNLDDIDEIKLNIPNGVVYDNPAKKEYNLINGVYGGKYEKTYSLTAAEDFTIPSVSLSYFDKKTNSVKKVSTKPYHIKVKGAKKVSKPKLQTVEDLKGGDTPVKEKIVTKVVKTSDNQKFVFYLFGLFCGIMVSLAVYFIKTKKSGQKSEIPIEKSIKRVKNKEELLKLMVIYINIDEELDKIIFALDNNCSDEEFKGYKKDMISLIKDKKLNI